MTLGPRFCFGTKAETLTEVASRVTASRVLDLYFFTVAEWTEDPENVLEEVRDRFFGERVAVRSSAIGEDGKADSKAGAYRSVLDVSVEENDELEAAIVTVVNSYEGNPLDQVLIQPMLRDVAMSGVVMTRSLDDGAPYYVLNYDDESGKTDTITGGTGVNKTVSVFRDVDLEQVHSERVRAVLGMCKELESIVGPYPLDIEFGLTDEGELFLFQLRRISVWQNWRAEIASDISRRLPHIAAFVRRRSEPRDHVLGRRTILGVMPDWNPAELVGTTPSRLSASLFRSLITRRVWAASRTWMGYRDVPGEELMVLLADRPYIDVRNSFNSFLPSSLEADVAERVVDAWLDRLAEHPELHDKVEFEVAQTCLDFTFDEDFESRYGASLDAGDGRALRERLKALTLEALRLDEAGTLARAESQVAELSERQKKRTLDVEGPASLFQVRSLLDECRALGTMPFCVIARHAFIAESLLRSAVKRGALSQGRFEAFKRSVRTVTGDFARELAEAVGGHRDPQPFLERFGHLRPGTYDIRSPRYVDRPELFRDCLVPEEQTAEHAFELSDAETRALTWLLKEIGAEDRTPDALLEYASRAIAGREHAKFVFTRNLSDALEKLARWGEELGLGREHLAHIDLRDILDLVVNPHLGDVRSRFFELADAGREANGIARSVKLGYLIRGEEDVYVVPQHRSAPNFVGSGRVRGAIAAIDASTSGDVPLFNRIVCVENADPGFDWIFGKGIAGLITKYGGANSHMAIRSAEFGIPAAIGCGEQLFERIVAAGAAELDCAGNVLKPVYGE